MAFASFEVVACAALAQSTTLVPAWLPEGRQHGDEWISKNPTRSDAAAGSFSINLLTGAWSDFAEGGNAKGGDLISLFAYLHGLPQGKACAALARDLGVAPPPPAAKTDNARHVSPVPDSAPEPPAAHKRHGKPSAQWIYCDPDGQVLTYQLRFETPDGKQFSPLTCWQNADTGSLFWRFRKAPGQAPLYRLDALYSRPDAPVCVCEGEKAADAAQRLLPDFVAVTSPNGAKAADKADWRPLRDRQVAIWPDSDAPGKVYAESVAAILKALGVAARIAPPIPDVEAGFDAADAQAAGWTQQQARDYVESATEAVISDRPARVSSAWKPRQQDDDQPVDLSRFNHAPQADNVEIRTTWDSVSDTTHLANAYRIQHYYKDRIFYALGAGWIMWNGQFWQTDPTNEGSTAIGFITGLSRRIAQEAGQLAMLAGEEADKDLRKVKLDHADNVLKWASTSEAKMCIASGLALAKHALLIDFKTLNSDPWLLNTQNGTIDLRTGTIRPHDPADRLTFIAPVTFDPTATCPTWERFISEVFAGDAEMISFIQRAIGWSLTGVVKERALFFLYGNTGKNGKTTMVETIQKLLGTCSETDHGYSRKVGADTFMKSKNMEDNQRKAATLAGPRFICTSEVDEEHRLNEQLIKDITGGDTIEGRRLYQEAFTFKPQFKPWMYGNHRPEIRGTDDAIWSRVRLVPFEVSFAGREDFDLGDKLAAELPGILNWAIAGCLAWQRQGLRPPAKVEAATQAYRDEMDVFGPFISEFCVIHPHAEAWTNQLYAAYQAWCSENGRRPENATKFGRYLNAKGFRTYKSHGKIKRLGIGLLESGDSGDSGEGSIANFPIETSHRDFPKNYPHYPHCPPNQNQSRDKEGQKADFQPADLADTEDF